MMLSSRRIFSFGIILLSLIGYSFIVFAAAPTGGYLPGQELEPDCQPGEGANTANPCIVQPYQIVTSTDYTWIGTGTGGGGASQEGTFFAGIGAGYGATDADNSNMVGTDAGQGATNAFNANMFGPSAGCFATHAHDANMFGLESGCYAAFADNANMFGNRSGYYATHGDHTVFFGDHAGFGANEAEKSNFIGFRSGYNNTFSGATDNDPGTFSELSFDPKRSNFFGYESGFDAAHASDSNFSGFQAGYEATDASFSNFFGSGAGYRAYKASNSVMMGYRAGYNENSSDIDFLGPGQLGGFPFEGYATFVGYNAGYGASGAISSTFIGTQAGYKANYAPLSTFIGYGAGSFNDYQTGLYTDGPTASTFVGVLAGRLALHARNAVMVGNLSGQEAENARFATFLGDQSGRFAVNSFGTVMIGKETGDSATSSELSIFIGSQAGQGAISARNSIFIGDGAGTNDTVTNTLSTLSYTGLTGGDFVLGDKVSGVTSQASATIVGDDGFTLELGAVRGEFIPGEVLLDEADNGDITATAGIFSAGSYSILIGGSTDTGGNINSIAMGTFATNTAENQFLVGSDNYPIDQFVMVGTGGATCATDANGTSCSSDENLKKNITDLDNNVLDTLKQVRTVTFNWKNGEDNESHIGFIAQDMQEYFPELVSEGATGYLSVNYAGMAPILTEAIRELDLKISKIEQIASIENETFLASIIEWFADATNGIGDFFAGTLHAKNQICIDDVCIDKSDFQKIVDEKTNEPEGEDTSPDPDPEIILDETPDPEVVPDPDPEVTPDPTLEPEIITDPTVEPEVVPDPEETPEPEAPAPEPESSPEPTA